MCFWDGAVGCHDAVFRDSYAYLFERYEEKYQSDHHYVSFIDLVRFRTQENKAVVLTAVSMRLLGIYAGMIFFIICMTVLVCYYGITIYAIRRNLTVTLDLQGRA